MTDLLRDHEIERSGHIPEVFRITSSTHTDERGCLYEAHRCDWSGAGAAALGGADLFCQINVSISVPWALRGIHYQADRPQGKLVRCIAGSLFDVALDLRRSSPTFGKHASFNLAPGQGMWVPPGFAHGFLAGSDGATIVYMFTDYHDADAERAIYWRDPALRILWPLPIDDDADKPIASSKDVNAPMFDQVTETYP